MNKHAESIFPRESVFDENIPLPPSLKLRNNKAYVIGIIGNSQFGKSAIINSVAGVPVFSEVQFDSNEFSEQGCSIQMYHDTTKNLIYLQHLSIYDSKILDIQIEQLLKSSNTDNFSSWLEKAEYPHLKSLLYIFLVSHLILVNKYSYLLQLFNFF